jgi:hypothetical protein
VRVRQSSGLSKAERSEVHKRKPQSGEAIVNSSHPSQSVEGRCTRR